MRRLGAILILLSAGLLAGCQALGDSTNASEGKRSGGLLSVLRPALITIPEGATFPLVLETAISSATSRSGDLVVARLAEEIRIGEKVVVPSGSEVRGRVTAAVPSGRVKTRARLAFAFDTLVLEGKEHPIGTRPVDITARDTHKQGRRDHRDRRRRRGHHRRHRQRREGRGHRDPHRRGGRHRRRADQHRQRGRAGHRKPRDRQPHPRGTPVSDPARIGQGDKR